MARLHPMPETHPPQSTRRPTAGADGRKTLQQKVEGVEERTTPGTPVIYEVVRRIGDEEMARPALSLWWSGLAAGLSISFSLLAQAVLQTQLPDAPWRELVSNFGYPVGFLMVVLSRQQLFTENTITTVLPVMAAFSLSNFLQLCRIWGIVLLANIAGTLAAATLCSYAPILDPDLSQGMVDISRQLLGHDWIEMGFKGIGAGYLIAAMVWLLHGSETAQFHVIILLTYLIAAAGFAHIVAGSVEAFMLFLNGIVDGWWIVGGFFVPVLIGNILGGTALFALISYAQVMQEI